MRVNKTLLLFLLFPIAGCLKQTGIPPEPTNDVERAVIDSRGYHAELGESFIRAADRVASGELDSDIKANMFLAKANKTARGKAFSSIDRYLQTQLGDGKWTRSKAEKVFREIGEALGK